MSNFMANIDHFASSKRVSVHCLSTYVSGLFHTPLGEEEYDLKEDGGPGRIRTNDYRDVNAVS